MPTNSVKLFVFVIIMCTTAILYANNKKAQPKEEGFSMLTMAVKTALLVDPKVKGLKINVVQKGQSIILKGEVDSEASKMLASDIALKVDGVEKVVNNLTIHQVGVGSAYDISVAGTSPTQ